MEYFDNERVQEAKKEIEKRKKVEILVDEICVNDCPFHYQHYKEYAFIQLHGYPEKENKE